jgi:hypothetical protein
MDLKAAVLGASAEPPIDVQPNTDG